MPMQRDRYPPNWKEISLARRVLAQWKCEWCGGLNGTSHLAAEGAARVHASVAESGTPSDEHAGR